MMNTKLILVGIVLLTVASPYTHSQASGFTNSVPVKKFDTKVTDHVIARIGNINKVPTSAKELYALSALYKQALVTKSVRVGFMSALNKYHQILLEHGSFLAKQQGYYDVGVTAESLLQAAQDLDRQSKAQAERLDFHYREIQDEVGAYDLQRSQTLRELIDKTRLLGMSETEVNDLLKTLDITGKHLDVAINSLRQSLIDACTNPSLQETGACP